MENSFTEENYLKAIFKLSRRSELGVSTNALAERMDTKASSVTDMMKRLSAKNLVDYQKYQGVMLTEKGKKIKPILQELRKWGMEHAWRRAKSEERRAKGEERRAKGEGIREKPPILRPSPLVLRPSPLFHKLSSLDIQHLRVLLQ